MSLYEKKFLEYKGELPIALQTNFFLEQESCISLYQEEKNGKEPLQHTHPLTKIQYSRHTQNIHIPITLQQNYKIPHYVKKKL